MSGLAIIAALIEADAALLAAIPVTQIKAGRLPDDAVLPAMLLREVSENERQTLRRGSSVRTTTRVSCALRVSAYEELEAILKKLRTACAGKTGTIAGFSGVSVLTAGAGPDLNGPGNTFERTQDFSVSFDAPV